MLKIYLKVIEDIKTTVLSLIEKERNAEINGQNKSESVIGLTESALGETDRFFEQIMGLPGDGEEFYRCRVLMIEALEDLRESFEKRYSVAGIPGSSGSTLWQARRAGYLLKMQAAEQEVRNLNLL